jgi:hypothetical protein
VPDVCPTWSACGSLWQYRAAKPLCKQVDSSRLPGRWWSIVGGNWMGVSFSHDVRVSVVTSPSLSPAREDWRWIEVHAVERLCVG